MVKHELHQSFSHLPVFSLYRDFMDIFVDKSWIRASINFFMDSFDRLRTLSQKFLLIMFNVD